MPRGRKVSPEQIVVMLRQIEVQLAQSKSLALACKDAGISELSLRIMPEAGDLLQLEKGAGRDRGLEGPLQPHPAALLPRLPTTCARHPAGIRKAATHTSHYAVVSLNPVQNPGQATLTPQMAGARVGRTPAVRQPSGRASVSPEPCYASLVIHPAWSIKSLAVSLG